MLRSSVGFVSANTPHLMDVQSLIDADEISVDIEATGVNPITDYPYGFSITSREDEAYYSDMYNRIFLDIVANESTRKIMYNGKYDRLKFKQAGIIIDNIVDPMIGVHMLEMGGQYLNNLEDTCYRILGDRTVEMTKYSDLADKNLAIKSVQEMAEFSGPHALNTLLLWNYIKPLLKKEGLWNAFFQIEMPVLPVLSDMEENGVLIDKSALEELGKYYGKKKAILIDSLNYYAAGHQVQGINWNSADQVANLFYEKMHFPKPPAYTWRGKKRPSVEKKLLKKVFEKAGRTPDVVNLYFMYKEYEHLQNTYVDGIIERLLPSGRVHTNFNQNRTDTGRLSSTQPNLQNQPSRSEEGRKIRKAYIARPGCKLVKSDFEQMELRAMAHYSNCTPMIDAFNTGRDIHTETAVRAYNDNTRRADGKTLNFQLINGGGTEQNKEMMFKIYPQIKWWMDRAFNMMESLGYARSFYGRKRTLYPGIMTQLRQENNYMFEELCRGGVSLMIQGSSAEFCKVGMVNVWKYIKDSDIKLELQVHDELVLEVPNELVQDVADLLYDKMQYRGLKVPMPVEVKVGNNWSDMIKIKPSWEQKSEKVMVTI